MRLYFKPLVLMIWLGAVVMFIGGALSLSDRRLRVGAPRPAKARTALAGGGVKIVALLRALLRPSTIAWTPAAAVGVVAATRGRSPTRCWRTRRWKRGRGRCRRNCAAWCARTSRSTISEAPLAHDLRVLVRERLKAGDSDAQVLDFLVARYGEFVLLKPRLSWHTAVLWCLPPALSSSG